ncbi:MAG: hypothetical protein HY979_01375 [Candidatus Magasanikbacteria bacterium]|nr:hypothetical protein [Candidatus Magasanikbacteria bacterium]
MAYHKTLKNNKSKPVKIAKTTEGKRKKVKASEHKKLIKKCKSVLKKSTLGFEVEFLILDKNGQVSDKADVLLDKLAEKNRDPHSEIVKEVAKNIIEVGSYHDVDSVNTLQALLNNIQLLLYTADELNLAICPLATYPGKFTPKIRQDLRYKVQMSLFGQKRFLAAGRVVGYHFHYALPWGVFNQKKLTLKKLINSKNKQSLVNAYNFLVAADPAITTFMQSSPFYQGRYLGKDARLLVYRGSKELEYPDGLYSDFPQFGALPMYAHTGTNIIDRINTRHHDWFEALKASGVREADFPKYKSILDTNWTPVKLNKHGTLEQRGMDMNHLVLLESVSFLLSRVLKAIQENFVKVETADFAIDEPFKIEKDTIYIPPDTYVIKELQKLSVYKGMESDVMWYYCKRLVWLVRILEGKRFDDWLLEPLDEMIKNRKTVSDEIIEQAKQLGYTNYKKVMPKEIAAQIAIDHSQRLFKEIVLAQKYIDEYLA